VSGAISLPAPLLCSARRNAHQASAQDAAKTAKVGPRRCWPREVDRLELLRLDPKGVTSYFEWLAEHHPAIFASLLGRAMPLIMQHEGGDGGIEVVYRTPEEIETALRSQNLPMLERVIDLENPPTIDVTPNDEPDNTRT
jgi:hypothetical protein